MYIVLLIYLFFSVFCLFNLFLSPFFINILDFYVKHFVYEIFLYKMNLHCLMSPFCFSDRIT